MNHSHIAIIGAGVSGLAAARNLAEGSYILVDKSRGPGGRLAAKRIGGSRADIGAQFFTVRDPRFEAVVFDALHEGMVAQWRPSMGKIVENRIISSPDSQRRYIGTPYMNAFGRYLAKNVKASYETRVKVITQEGSYFLLTDTNGQHFSADKVLVTTPVDQMVSMLGAFDTDFLNLQFGMSPTWTCVFEMHQTLTSFDNMTIEACFGADHPIIDFLAMERSKEGRTGQYLIVHTTPVFSKANLAASTDHILDRVSDALTILIGLTLKPIVAHLWKYARPADHTKAAQKGVFEIAPNLWIAGDYLSGGRVEGAYLSGLEASKRLT